MAENTVNPYSSNTPPILLWNHNYHKIISPLLQKAKKEILISAFKIECPKTAKDYALKTILSPLIQKKSPRPDIKILLHWSQNRPGPPRENICAARYLSSQGVQIKHFKTKRIIHAKIIIIDEKYLTIGSHNLSSTSLQHNLELSALIQYPDLIQEVRKSFLHYWDEAIDFPHPPPQKSKSKEVV